MGLIDSIIKKTIDALPISEEQKEIQKKALKSAAENTNPCEEEEKLVKKPEPC